VRRSEFGIANRLLSGLAKSLARPRECRRVRTDPLGES
jgi:hypothetical protein